jgi:hypothetical protein
VVGEEEQRQHRAEGGHLQLRGPGEEAEQEPVAEAEDLEADGDEGHVAGD